MSQPALDNQDNKPYASPPGSFKIFDRSDWLALFAMLISMAALAVSAYEASILREQQQLMQTQQKASVWPYLLTDSSFEINISEGIATWTCKVTNKGVGPALIKNVRLLFDGQELDAYGEINDFFKQKFPANAMVALSYTDITGDVISNNERVELLRLITNETDMVSKLMAGISSEVEICFCSIYEDCWLATYGEVTSTTACE